MTYMIVSDLEYCCMEALESPEGKSTLMYLQLISRMSIWQQIQEG